MKKDADDMTTQEILTAIRTEIERLKRQLIRGACASQITMETNCKDEAYNEILSFLDTLEEKSEKPTNSVDVDREEIIGLSIMLYLDTHLKHENSVVTRGEPKVTKSDAREWIRRQIAREKSEIPINLDFEGELLKFGRENGYRYPEDADFVAIAVHFTELGRKIERTLIGAQIAEKIGSSEKPNNHLEHVPEIKEMGTRGLDEAAEEYANTHDEHLTRLDEEPAYIGCEVEDAFIAGAKWAFGQFEKVALSDDLYMKK